MGQPYYIFIVQLPEALEQTQGIIRGNQFLNLF